MYVQLKLNYMLVSCTDLCVYVSVQGLYVSTSVLVRLIHLHEFVHSGVWSVGDYCTRICRCHLDGEWWSQALPYLSYLFGLRLLSEDSYLLEELRSADKTKTHPKAKLQNAPIFTRNGSHCHVCLPVLLVMKIKTCTYQLCKWQYTNILISRYPLSADYRCICNHL